MNFLIGAIGAFLMLAVCAAGFAAGVYVESRLSKMRKPTPVEVPEKVKNRAQQQQEAFDAMQGYSVESAYALDSALPVDKG